VEVTQDAGQVSRWRRAPATAALPPGLDGEWWSAELDARWTVGGGRVRARGPVASNDTWEIEPVEGDQVRIHIPGTLYRAWLDVRLDGEGLLASGGRVKEMRLTRAG
jgi:D-aminopeptidase